MRISVFVIALLGITMGCSPKSSSSDASQSSQSASTSDTSGRLLPTPAEPEKQENAETPAAAARTEAEMILPPKAFDLQQEGWTYVDVRTVDEFTEAHPSGAWNVPIKINNNGSFEQNGDFLKIMEANFPKDTPIVCGCRSGRRSQLAADLLLQAGYDNVFNMAGGMVGGQGEDGLVKGWQESDLPTEEGDGAEKSYQLLRQQAGE
ncbi:MAG: rhodanese-like domain-containing protein [Phycisphaerae bacterium]